jgi:hypothetical protein
VVPTRRPIRGGRRPKHPRLSREFLAALTVTRRCARSAPSPGMVMMDDGLSPGGRCLLQAQVRVSPDQWRDGRPGRARHHRFSRPPFCQTLRRTGSCSLPRPPPPQRAGLATNPAHEQTASPQESDLPALTRPVQRPCRMRWPQVLQSGCRPRAGGHRLQAGGQPVSQRSIAIMAQDRETWSRASLSFSAPTGMQAALRGR